MNKMNYLIQLSIDGREFIEDNVGYYDSFEDLFDEMQNVITGNYNGSYYFSRYKAEQAVADAIWDDEIIDALKDLGYDGVPLEKGPEAVDVIIRCALIYEIHSELESYYDYLKGEKEEDTDED